MKNKFFPVVIVFFVLVIFSVLFIPASWLIHSHVEKFKYDWPELQAPSYQGYWRRGLFKDVSWVSRGHRIELEDVYWSYDWSNIFSTLFSSTSCASFYSSHPLNKLSFHACYQFSTQQLVVTNIQMNTNADEVGTVFGVDISGAVEVRLSKVLLSGKRVFIVDGGAYWNNALWHIGEQEVDLGRLDAKINRSEGNARTHLVVNNSSSDIAINFTGSIDEKNRLSGAGYIDIGSEMDEALVTTLRFFSNAESQGKFFFEK